MNRRPLLGVLAGILMIALVAAGCGSKKGAYQDSQPEFAKALNMICIAAKKKVDAIQISSIQELAEKGPENVAIFDDQIAQLKKLGTPPSAIKSQVDNIFAKSKDLRDLFNKVIDAAKANDEATVRSLTSEIETANQATDPDFTTIGAPACLSTN